MPEIAARHGDFDAWFLRAFEKTGLSCRVANVAQEPPPEARGAGGILITGSLASAYADEPWILRLVDWIRSASSHDIPTLGVCFGHQVLARALGGKARRNPAGREVGTPEVRLTPEGTRDWLFDGVPERFSAQLTHDDDVEVLPPGALLLAANDHTSVQAFALGDHLRGVQFHPEIDPSIMEAIVGYKVSAGILTEAALPTRLPIRPTPEAARVLSNFADRVKTGGNHPA